MIVMGYPGAGKTYFASQFAHKHDLPYVSEDRIRYELFEQPKFNFDEHDIIARIADYSLEQCLKTKYITIYDGFNLSLAARKRLFKLAYAYGYRTLTVWLQTDVQTSAERSAKRDRRNPKNKYDFPIDQATFDRLKSYLERPDDREEAVVISGKHVFRSQYVTVLKKIIAMYANKSAEVDFPSILKNELRPNVKTAEAPRTKRPIIQ